MKTTIFLSCLIAGAGLLMKNSGEKNIEPITYKHESKTMARKKNSGKPVGSVRIIISKRNYELSVYDEQGWYATYPVVFGNSSLADKKMEGDKNTPEGTFMIENKRVHQKWARYLGLNYPTTESLEKFQARKRRGEIPSWASPGGGVGIHGCWPKEDFVVDRYTNWTNGCIALKRADVIDLYSYIPVGTPIHIRR